MHEWRKAEQRRLIHGLVKQTHFCVNFICGHKTGAFQTAKLSVSKSDFDPIPRGHESWVITEIIPFQVQEAEMGFLRNVCSVTLREKVWSCEIRKTVNDPSYVSSAMWREYPRKDWRGKSCRLHPWESGSEVV